MLSKYRIILIAGVIGLIIVLTAGFLIFRKKSDGLPTQPTTLTVWGLFDNADVYAPLIAAYQKLRPNVSVTYRKLNFEDYEQTLFNVFASGRGPDIFILNNTWLPKYQSRIFPAPSEMLPAAQVRDAFVDTVSQDFIREGRVWALPLYVDTLALFYNDTIFRQELILEPPKTWREFIEVVKKLTQLDEKGDVVRSAAAIGTARNINRSTDILGMLMLQSGARMSNPAEKRATFHEAVNFQGTSFLPGEQALTFYTDFANPRKRVYTWSRAMDYSIDAFIAQKTAMMFGYAYQIPLIKTRAPYLRFKIAPIPQIDEAPNPVTYANYWGYTVSTNSKVPLLAWDFLRFIAKRENAAQYLALSRRPTARIDLIEEQKQDPELGLFAQQSLWATSWYQPDANAVEKIFANMIEDVVLERATPGEALREAADQITRLF